jgi:hypothetical protein
VPNSEVREATNDAAIASGPTLILRSDLSELHVGDHIRRINFHLPGAAPRPLAIPLCFDVRGIREAASRHKAPLRGGLSSRPAKDPAKGVKNGVVYVTVAQICCVLVVVGRLPLSPSVAVGLRRRNAGRRQYDSRCEDGSDLASHIGSPSHSFAALWSGPTNRMHLHPAPHTKNVREKHFRYS